MRSPRCSVCLRDLDVEEARALHTVFDDQTLLCNGRHGHIVVFIEDVTEMEKAVIALRSDLMHHREMEGVDVEVRGRQGWYDVIDMVDGILAKHT